MNNRNLDGVFFRVKREGEYKNICFSDLTEEEMIKVLKDKDTNWLKSMCLILGKRLKEIGNEFDLVCE